MGSNSKTQANWIARNARHEAHRQLRERHLDEFNEIYQAERERLQFMTGYEDGRSTPERRAAAIEAAASVPRNRDGGKTHWIAK